MEAKKENEMNAFMETNHLRRKLEKQRNTKGAREQGCRIQSRGEKRNEHIGGQGVDIDNGSF